jgi:geranylgeranyl diphosphate synthase type I
LLAGALTVIRCKAAKYTVSYPLEIGATLTGGDETLLGSLRAFGIPFGEAFQTRDDLLGVFGDPALTGKSMTEDLREGRPTVLMAVARRRATVRQAVQIQELHDNRGLDEEGAAILRGIPTDTGARAAVEDMIAERTREPMDALEAAPLTGLARDALRALAIAAAHRQA